MAQVRLLLDDSLLARLDRASGKQPRISWIRDAIEEKLRHCEPSILDSPMDPHPLTAMLAPTPRAELPLEPAVPAPPVVLAAVCSHSRTKTTGPFSAPVRTCLRCGEVRP